MLKSAATKTNANGNKEKDLAELLIEENKKAAERFVELSQRNSFQAIGYLNSLPSETRDYVQYSLISEQYFKIITNQIK